MPRLQQLLSRGAAAELRVTRPFDSAAFWTSIVTGKRAIDHNVVSAIEATPCGTRIRPTWRAACTAPAVWSLLSEAGYRTHAFGWPASHPAEPINGVTLSDLFAECGESGSVYPPSLLDTLSALRLTPADIDAASIVTLLPHAAELSAADQRLYVVAQFLALSASLHAAATWALEHQAWDFAAIRYAGLARLVSVFGNAHAAAQSGARTEDAEMFGGVIPNACRFFDMLLGRLVELAGSDASVMLALQPCLTAPSQPPTPRPPHSAPATVFAAGPAFRSSISLTDASICDVAPMILDLFGLRPVPESRSRMPQDELDEPPPPSSGQATNGESIAHLLALGYREQPDEFLRLAIEDLERERLWRLAEAHTDGGQFERAARILEQLVALEPDSIIYRSALAEAHFRAGQWTACRCTIEALLASGVDTPLARAGLAALDSLEGRPESAVTHLRKAEAIGGASAGVLEIIGRLYLGLRRRTDAARTLDAAIAADPSRHTAYEARAMTYLFAGDSASAETNARKSLDLNPQSYEGRCHLGLALARQNRADEAVAILREAVAVDRQGGVLAHRRLADVLEQRGDGALALHHRALADRRAISSRRSWFDFEWFNDVEMQ